MAPPLAGIRVLDFTRLLPGAFASLMLAELGAEVIKVEAPGRGDPMRLLPPLVGGRGIYHLLLDRGKKSVAIDLHQAGGAPALARLLETADVVMESFRPRTARRLGLSADQVRGRHPAVIHCAITGYGQTGPYAERPGHDLNYVAVSGLLAADRPNPTELPRMFMADVGGGAMTAVIGILAALVGRGRTGEGASLDISMHEASLYWVMLPAARELIDGGEAALEDLPTFGKHACYNVYRTRDGELVALGALEPRFWTGFCQAVGRADLAARHLTGEADQAALIAEIRALFETRTRAEWLALLEQADLCLTPVNRPSEAFADPHIQVRGAVIRGQGLTAVRPPFLRAAQPLAPAPAVGEHTSQILDNRDTGQRAE
jgi:crotonobetainyl-CoA:carnitine CoA-transferase CaiB-like acyl-CoA transferase